jgi:hypothetical protein
MNDVQFERFLSVLERIAESLENLQRLADPIDVVTHEDETETFVFNVWKEGESE